MIDSVELRVLIRSRMNFRLGARGICCECRRRNGSWVVSIPRASMELCCDELSVVDNEDFNLLSISFDGGKSSRSFLDLTQYDCLTLIG